MPDDQNATSTKIGRPREVSDETILATGRGLVHQGLEVTGSRLRGRIRHGNPYTLKQRWTALQGDSAPAQAVSEPDMPEALTAIYRDLRDGVDAKLYAEIKRAYEEGGAAWERRFQAERAELYEDQVQVHAEWVDTAQYYDELEYELQIAQEETTQAQSQLTETRGELDDVKMQLTAMSARADAAELQVKELQAGIVDWSTRATRAEAERDRLQEKLTAAKAAPDRFKQGFNDQKAERRKTAQPDADAAAAPKQQSRAGASKNGRKASGKTPQAKAKTKTDTNKQTNK